MQNFQDTFETQKRTFISAFSICMSVPLSHGTKIRTCYMLKIPCYMSHSACRWCADKKAKIF